MSVDLAAAVNADARGEIFGEQAAPAQHAAPEAVADDAQPQDNDAQAGSAAEEVLAEAEEKPQPKAKPSKTLPKPKNQAAKPPAKQIAKPKTAVEAQIDEAVDEPAAEEASEEEIAEPASTRVKISVGGKEIEVEPEVAEAIKAAESLKSERRRFQNMGFEATRAKAALEKEIAALKEGMKKNPIEILEQNGVDLNAFAEQRKAAIEQFNQLPPEHQRALLAQEQVRQQQEQLANKQREFESTQSQARTEAFVQKIRPAFEGAMEKHNLPRHPFVLEFMRGMGAAQMEAQGLDFPDMDYAGSEAAALIEEASDARLASLPPESLANKLSSYDQRLAELPAATLLKLFPGLFKKVQAHQVVSATKPPAVRQSGQAAVNTPRQSAPRQNAEGWKGGRPKDLMREIGRRLGVDS